MAVSTGVRVSCLLILVVAAPAMADAITDDFTTLDEDMWRPVNMLRQPARGLPGLAVTASDGVLRIAGRTSDEGINLGGVRSSALFRATPESPFSVRVTRRYHGGRTEHGELGVVLFRSAGELIYVKEPLSSLFKDWDHYQSWQVLMTGSQPLATDITDEAEFIRAHPQDSFDCRLHRIPRLIEVRHDGRQVTVAIDGAECFARDVEWNDGFTVALVAGGLSAGIPIDVGFSDLAIEGEVMARAAVPQLDARSFEPTEPTYWTGDTRLDLDAAERVLAAPPSAQAAMVIRSRWTPAVRKQFIDWSVDKGLNCIAFDIPWREVERTPGEFDFSAYDGLINYAVNRGLWVQIKPWWIRRSYPDWISPELEQEPLSGPRKLQELTFANTRLNEHIARFVRATVEHYRGYPVTCYTPVGATAAELEYSHADWRDGSHASVAQFHEWLRARCGTVGALNDAWGTKLESFGDAEPPGDLTEARAGPELRQSVLDWFCYREWSIKQLVDLLGEAVHKADPTARFAIQVGRIHDGPSCPKRATLGIFYWGEAADMLIADPQPKNGDVMGYIADLIRASGKIPAMELDAPARFEIPLTEYTRNTVELWRHGGLWGSWANWVPDELSQPEVLALTEATVTAMSDDHAYDPPTTAMYVSKWDLYCYHGQDRWREYRDAYAELTDGGKRVIDVITDDLLLARPETLDGYERVVVPYADCLDERIAPLLADLGERLERLHEDEFATRLLSVSCEPLPRQG